MEKSLLSADATGDWFFRDLVVPPCSSTSFCDDLPSSVHLWDLATSVPVPELANPSQICEASEEEEWLCRALEAECASTVHSSFVTAGSESGVNGDEDSRQDQSGSCLYMMETEEETDITASFLCYAPDSVHPFPPPPHTEAVPLLTVKSQNTGARRKASEKLKPGKIRLRGILSPSGLQPRPQEGPANKIVDNLRSCSDGGNLLETCGQISVQSNMEMLVTPQSSPWKTRRTSDSEVLFSGALHPKDMKTSGLQGALPTQCLANIGIAPEKRVKPGAQLKCRTMFKSNAKKSRRPFHSKGILEVPGSPSHSMAPSSPQLSRVSVRPNCSPKRSPSPSGWVAPRTPSSATPNRKPSGRLNRVRNLTLGPDFNRLSPRKLLSPRTLVSGSISPFSLVKPNSVDGSLTLKDLNHMINNTSKRQQTISPENLPSMVSSSVIPSLSRHETYSEGRPSSEVQKVNPFSDGPVVHVTRLRTLGNGTITIKRTRG